MKHSFALLPLLAPAALGQELLIPDSTADVVMKFSAVDGSLIDANFLPLMGTTTAPATPIEVIEVNGEYWVSDQIADVIFRFDPSGAFLGEYASGRDNMRGIGLANGAVWVSNSGTSNAGYGDAIKEYATDGTFLNAYAASDPFDTLDYNGEILVSDISGEDIDRYDYAGNFLGEFHDSDGVTGIDFPEQVAVKGSNGNVLAAGFSAPSGIYEYDPTGAQVDYIDTSAMGFSGLRGVVELQNGNLIFTNGSGVHVYDTATGGITTVLGGVSGRFITILGGNDLSLFCNPAATNSAGTSVSLANSDFSGPGLVHLEADGGPAAEFGYFLVSSTFQDPGVPVSQGFICVGAPQGRYNGVSGANSVGQFDAAGIFQNLSGSSSVGSGFDVPAALPNPPGGVIVSGDTYHFQLWYRDGPNSNFSNGLTVVFP